ncbi:MFS transporter [Novosphingobium flavum]|uniref:MFS transporter n=1 Tax=Novosphingobium flavum TaxID=1778672 RepID=A0A7X1FQ86_9SPHN|nr:MFS transporter [Novosphingobium flavum]MBC2664923.1 MFS transporter [Novosphingobium flavum]
MTAPAPDGTPDGPAPDSFRAAAIPIAGATFLSMVGVGMLVPALPELARGAPDPALAAGSLIGAYGFSRLLFNAPSGLALDRIGIARAANVGLLLLAANSALGYFSAHYVVLLAVMAIQGAASSLFSTAAMTALVLKAGPAARGRAMAWFQSSLLLGFATGPVIGGQVVDRFDPHLPFLLQVGIALLAMLAVRAMPGGTGKPGQGKPQGGPGGAPAASVWKTTLVLGGLAGFAAFATRFGIAWNLVPVEARGPLQLSNGELGWIIGLGTLANLAVTPFLGKLIDGYGARPTYAVAAVLSVAAMVLLLTVPSRAVLWLATALILLATGVMIPAAAALALTGAEPRRMGQLMGIYRTMAESGMAIGPVALPAFTAALGLPVVSGLLPCIALTALAACIVLVIGRRPSASELAAPRPGAA